MIGKKLILSKLLYYSRLISLFKHTTNSKLVVCNYHRVYDNELITDFDDGVFAHNLKQFKSHLLWLRNNTYILSENELISMLLNGNCSSKLYSLITFDDGYIDNYTLAYPVLKTFNIPAIYFIPSEQIMSRQLGWWDIIAYLFKKTTKKSISYDNQVISLLNTNIAIQKFHEIMKVRPHQETANLISILSNECDVPLPSKAMQSKQLMTWDQIREVSDNGISIGSHTHSHRVLSTISNNEQIEEMLSSKVFIEREIGKKIRTIAYPVGNYQHFTPETMTIASECGYEAAFSFNTGVNNDYKFSPYNIKRIEPSTDVELLAATVFFPKIFI